MDRPVRLIVGYFAAIALLLGGLYSFGLSRAEAASAEPLSHEATPQGIATTDVLLAAPDDEPVEAHTI